VPEASVATAVDSGARRAARFNSSHLEETVYATGALAGDPRENAHYMELRKEDVTRCEISCVSAL
jgi:hypothetical protein